MIAVFMQIYKTSTFSIFTLSVTHSCFKKFTTKNTLQIWKETNSEITNKPRETNMITQLRLK